MSETPRTDALVAEWSPLTISGEQVATLARSFERELAAANEKAAQQGRYACEMFDEAKRCQTELSQLRAELEGARRDAERYQWLCRDKTRGHLLYLFGIVCTEPKERLDASIDAAMKK